MAAETNVIKKADVARVRSIDFVTQFNGGLQKITEVLGITRKIPVQAGTALMALKATGTLQSGTVAEGDIIPLSNYQTTDTQVGVATVKKWRKSTTLEAILKGGYDQAVGATTNKMINDIQKGIRSDFIGYLANGLGTASGVGLQAALANAWGVSQVLWEDDAVDMVYILNPMDIADYLGTTQVGLANAFGFSYVENFLGLGTVITSSLVPTGTFYATAKENVVMYHVDVTNGDVADAFDLIADELGLVGIHEYADDDRACVNDLIVSGVSFFPERLDGVVVGTITDSAADDEASDGE